MQSGCPGAEMTSQCNEMLQKVLETFPSSLFPKGALRSSCDVGTMSCTTILAVNPQVTAGREDMILGRRTGTGLPLCQAHSWALGKLAAQSGFELRLPDPHPLLQFLHGGASFPPWGEELSHRRAHFTQVTWSEALTPFSGNKISHLRNKNKTRFMKRIKGGIVEAAQGHLCVLGVSGGKQNNLEREKLAGGTGSPTAFLSLGILKLTRTGSWLLHPPPVPFPLQPGPPGLCEMDPC